MVNDDGNMWISQSLLNHLIGLHDVILLLTFRDPSHWKLSFGSRCCCKAVRHQPLSALLSSLCSINGRESYSPHSQEGLSSTKSFLCVHTHGAPSKNTTCCTAPLVPIIATKQERIESRMKVDCLTLFITAQLSNNVTFVCNVISELYKN